MNTRFLETLVVLSRLKSFRETAQVLHTTQAAASQRIAALEDELGGFLVDRSHPTLTLTPPCPPPRSARGWCGRPSACWRGNASSSARPNPRRPPPGACASA